MKNLLFTQINETLNVRIWQKNRPQPPISINLRRSIRTHATTGKRSWRNGEVLNASITAALLLAVAVPSYAADLPASVAGRASDALVTLATTGNPEPLHAEIGGTVISSQDLQKKVGALMKLQKAEHLAPKALVAPNGETYAMVAPTLTKDNFIFADS